MRLYATAWNFGAGKLRAEISQPQIRPLKWILGENEMSAQMIEKDAQLQELSIASRNKGFTLRLGKIYRSESEPLLVFLSLRHNLSDKETFYTTVDVSPHMHDFLCTCDDLVLNFASCENYEISEHCNPLFINPCYLFRPHLRDKIDYPYWIYLSVNNAASDAQLTGMLAAIRLEYRLQSGANGTNDMSMLLEDLVHNQGISSASYTTIPKISEVIHEDPIKSRLLRLEECIPLASVILPGKLYVGGAEPAKDRTQLLALGITRIINLSPSSVPNYYPDLFSYVTVPVYDTSSEDIGALLPFILRAIEGSSSTERRFRSCVLEEDKSDLFEESSVIYMHCQQGASRSVAFAAAYLMWRFGMCTDSALGHIKNKRSIASPNTGFLAQLFVYQEKLSNHVAHDFYRVGYYFEQDWVSRWEEYDIFLKNVNVVSNALQNPLVLHKVHSAIQDEDITNASLNQIQLDSRFIYFLETYNCREDVDALHNGFSSLCQWWIPQNLFSELQGGDTKNISSCVLSRSSRRFVSDLLTCTFSHIRFSQYTRDFCEATSSILSKLVDLNLDVYDVHCKQAQSSTRNGISIIYPLRFLRLTGGDESVFTSPLDGSKNANDCGDIQYSKFKLPIHVTSHGTVTHKTRPKALFQAVDHPGLNGALKMLKDTYLAP